MVDLEGIDKEINILVADDYAATRDMIRAILKQLGFNNIFTAENGKKALEKINTEEIGLVICDWNMPVLSGIELLKEIRTKPKTKDLPFLMLTAEAYRENVKQAISAGVTDYISKPFTGQVLAEKIEAALSASEDS